MPNWCYINFTVSGPAEEISRFREAVRSVDDSGETAVDFNMLVQMPSELHDTTADGTAYEVYHGNPERILGRRWVKELGIETVEQLREHFDADPQRRAIADQWKANIEKYGAPTWYEWSVEHWGTKWNACHPKVTENGDGSVHVQFDTAWTFPFPIFEKVAADFPTLIFEGSAQEPNTDIYISFEARNGEIACKDDEDARAEAAAASEDEGESLMVTA